MRSGWVVVVLVVLTCCSAVGRDFAHEGQGVEPAVPVPMAGPHAPPSPSLPVLPERSDGADGPSVAGRPAETSRPSQAPSSPHARRAAGAQGVAARSPYDPSLPKAWSGGAPLDVRAVLIRIGWATAAVLVLGIAVLLAIPPWFARTTGSAGGDAAAHLCQTLPLGARCWVYLVRVGPHQVLIARDAQGLKDPIVLPPTFPDALAEDTSLEEPPPAGPNEVPAEAVRPAGQESPAWKSAPWTS